MHKHKLFAQHGAGSEGGGGGGGVGRKEKKEVKSSSLPNSFDDDCSTCTDEISDPNILLQKS